MSKVGIAKERNSSFELLRIILMLFIISTHYDGHGVGAIAVNQMNIFLTAPFGMLGNVAVCCFVLISGYFLSEIAFSFFKLLVLIGEIWFYSYVFLVVRILLNSTQIPFDLLIKSLFPITASLNWFAATYVAAYLFIPYIKMLSVNMRAHPQRYCKLLCLLTVIFSAIGTLTPINPFVSNLAWFLFLFLVGDYLRYHLSIKYCKRLFGLILFVVPILLAWGIYIFLSILGEKYTIFDLLRSHLMKRYSLAVLVSAVGLVIVFSKLDFQSKLINSLSATCFGVYLIHDNPLIKRFIWDDIVHAKDYADSSVQLVHLLLWTLLIFITCAAIDMVRIKTINVFWKKFLKLNEARLKKFEEFVYGDYNT